MSSTLLIMPSVRTSLAFTNVPDVLVAHHGKPILLHVLQSLQNESVNQLIIFAEDHFLWQRWLDLLKDRMQLIVIPPHDIGQNTGAALKIARPYITSTNRVLVYSDWDIIETAGEDCLYHQFSSHQIHRRSMILTKSGDGEALAAEAYYYQHNKATTLFPRIDEVTSTSISMQFWPAHSLAYYWLFFPLGELVQQTILTNLWSWLERELYSQSNNQALKPLDTVTMYGTRILDRVAEWQQQLSGDDAALVSASALYYNGQHLIGWPQISSLILPRAQLLAQTVSIHQIHGDLHFANILYSPEQELFCLLDPRGAWGNQFSLSGDLRYDLAKFIHSFHGGYEWIKNGLSSYEEEDSTHYRFQLPVANVTSVDCLKPLCHRFQLEIQDIFWIEALCFLSMSKFYSSRSLQKQFFLQGLFLINQLL